MMYFHSLSSFCQRFKWASTAGPSPEYLRAMWGSLAPLPITSNYSLESPLPWRIERSFNSICSTRSTTLSSRSSIWAMRYLHIVIAASSSSFAVIEPHDPRLAVVTVDRLDSLHPPIMEDDGRRPLADPA